MNVTQILAHDATLEVRLGRFEEFADMGPIESDSDLLLTYATNKRFVQAVLSKRNVAVLFARPQDLPEEALETTVVLTEDPQAAFFRFHNYLAAETDFYGASQASSISPDADIHPTAYIAERDVRIEAGASVGPKAVLLEGSVLEARAAVGPGAVLGVSGAQLVTPVHGDRFQVTHVGGVLLRVGAYVGANSIVAGGVWRRPTTIGRNAYVGNLASVGHNCILEADALVISGAVLCGSVHVEEGATVAPAATVSHLKRIGRGAWVSLGAVVTQDVEPGSRVSGNFAIEHAKLLEHVKKLSAG